MLIQLTKILVISSPSDSLEEPRQWLPYTLRWYFYWIPTSLSLVLSIVVILLCWYSETNNGLGDDNNSSILFFGWRFTPTLITVLYAQLIMMVFHDIRRTEPFARMARYGSSDACSTILAPRMSWWTALRSGFSPKKNGGRRNWLLVYASLAYALASLAISPLSSSLLIPNKTMARREMEFKRMVPGSGSGIPPKAGRDTYFRTMSNFVNDIRTTAWISGPYTVMPFWPSNLPAAPLDATIPGSVVETWEADTLVFSTSLDCEPLTLSAKINETWLSSWKGGNKTFNKWDGNLRYNLTSPGGCMISIVGEVSDNFLKMSGGGWWIRMPMINGSVFRYDIGNITYDDSRDPKACDDRELFLVTTPWLNNNVSLWDHIIDFQPDFAVQGALCSYSTYMAKMPVRLSINTTREASVLVDEEAFRKKRALVPEATFNGTQIENLVLTGKWSNYMGLPERDNRLKDTPRPRFQGPLVILAGLYDFDTTAIVRDQSLLQRAIRFRERFFGEIILYSVLQRNISTIERVSGHIESIERRLIVFAEVGYALAVLFFVVFIFLSATFWLSRILVRPLNLIRDISSALGVALLITSNSDSQKDLRNLTQNSRASLVAAIHDSNYFTSLGRLHVSSQSAKNCKF